MNAFTEQLINKYSSEAKAEAAVVRGGIPEAMLVFIPSYIPHMPELKKTLFANPANILLCGTSGEALEAADCISDQNEAEILEAVSNAKRICFVSPGLKEMADISAFDDSKPIPKAALRALSWGKSVSVYTEMTDDAPANTVSKKTSELLSELSRMGIEIVRYCEASDPVGSSSDCPETSMPVSTAKTLICEEDIEEVLLSGRKSLPIGHKCIVTPLAYDRAAELGIQIERSKAC